jgi:aspartyl-tRNA(Asn)/glutamyl-tRNA(Gln) amidotransferase subunit A
MTDTREWSLPALGEHPIDSTSGPAVRRLDGYLRQLAGPGATLNAVVAVDLERGFADAERLDELAAAGHRCGPLHGMPVVVKDNIDVEGLPTTNGSASHDGGPAPSDAVVVRRLRRAGAIVFGKANMDEMALGATGANSRYPKVLNAWAPDRLPGGSSGGSAVAVSAGLAYGALGSDTGGSVRTPAAFNGIVSLRPSTGALSTEGVLPLSPRFDTVGPMGRNVDTVQQLLVAMADTLPADPVWGLTGYPRHVGAAPLEGLRIGIFGRYFFENASDGVVAAVMGGARALTDLGARLVEIDVADVASTQDQMSTIMLRDGYLTYRDLIDDDHTQVHPAVLERVLKGKGVTDADYAAALAAKDRWSWNVEQSFEAIDVFLLPTTPVVAPLIGENPSEVEAVMNVTQFTFPWSFAGVPALSIPCGMSEAMPVGMQLVGPRGTDLSVCRIASLYEHETLLSRAFDESRSES